MAGVKLNKVLSLDDPVLTHRFELRFARIPKFAGDSYDMTVKCLSCSTPSRRVGEIIVEMFGHSVKWAGRKLPSENLQAMFLEVGTMRTYSTLRRWQEYVVKTNSGNTGASKTGTGFNGYSVLGLLNPVSETGLILPGWLLYNIWPSSIQPPEFNGTSAEAAYISAEFAYDYDYYIDPAGEIQDILSGGLSKGLSFIADKIGLTSSINSAVRNVSSSVLSGLRI